ncbi:MAG: phosphoglucosamine mutase [bacterium]
MKRQWFGTDGIRGVFGKEPMTPEFIFHCGQAAAEFFREKEKKNAPEFIIGRDTRASGLILEQALAAGIEAGGGKVACIGVLPTAAVAIVTKERGAAAGVMISASHNPHEDNGVKFFGADGFKLNDAAEFQIEQKLDSRLASLSGMTGSDVFDKVNIPLNFEAESNAKEIYQKTLLAGLSQNFSLAGLTIVVDSANGAAWQTTPEFLRAIGAEVIALAATPDGQNINLNCGSLHTETLQKKIKEIGRGAIGLAHDGDADRLIMADENGEVLDGDELMAIVATDWLKKKKLAQNTLIATSMSNLGLDEALKRNGGQVLRTDVGDRYVLEAMRSRHLNMGGEQSGHMLFLDYCPTGDGLLAALQVLQIMVEKRAPLKELRRVMRRYPQYLVNVDVREKPPLDSLPSVRQAILEAERQLGADGRILLRYSGTENKARLLIEAKEASTLPMVAETILRPLRETIGI